MSDSADDFLSDLGLTGDEKVDPNDRLWEVISAGKFTKLDNMIYWLKGEIVKFNHLKEHHVNLTKSSISKGAPVNKHVSRMEYSKLMLMLYLQMYHLPHFSGQLPTGACSYQIIIDKIVAHAPMRDVIENYEAN